VRNEPPATLQADSAPSVHALQANAAQCRRCHTGRIRRSGFTLGRREVPPAHRAITDAVCALPSSVVLVGALSNPELQDLFQRLTSQPRRKHRKTKPDTVGPDPDGRRRFGSVSGAIVQVLTEAQSDLRVKEIWAEVERLLGEPVSRHSVKSYLHRGTHELKIFERVRQGRYRRKA
jgi:hypothetical protein